MSDEQPTRTAPDPDKVHDADSTDDGDWLKVLGREEEERDGAGTARSAAPPAPRRPQAGIRSNQRA